MVEVKTTYTVEEFANYLAYAVLNEASEHLGWGELIAAVPPEQEVRTVTSNTASSTTVLTVPAIGVDYPAGTLIFFETGVTAYTLNDEVAGATVIETNMSATLNQLAGKKALFTYKNYAPPIPNPRYIYVVDEALRQMGIENIEQINASNVREFRVRGRLELLRRVAEGRTFMYDYIADAFTDAPLTRSPSEVTRQILDLLVAEEARLADALLPAPVDTITEVTFNVPEEANSTSSEVSVRW